MTERPVVKMDPRFVYEEIRGILKSFSNLNANLFEALKLMTDIQNDLFSLLHKADKEREEKCVLK